MGRTRAGIFAIAVVFAACGDDDGMVIDAGAGDSAMPDGDTDGAIDDAGALACSPGPDGLGTVEAMWNGMGASPVPLADFCMALRDAVCEPLADCGCSSGDVAACNIAVTRLCEGSEGPLTPQMRAAIMSGDAMYDAAAAGLLVQVVRAASAKCDVARDSVRGGLLLDAIAALHVVHGSLAPGESCDPDTAFVCPEGTRCTNTGDFVYECASFLPPEADCSALGICLSQGSDAPQLRCSGVTCDQGLPPGAIEGSVPGRHCRYGADASGACACPLVAGEACTSWLQCETTFCGRASDDAPEGACAERTAELGGACGSDVGCREGACVSGACTALACVGWR